MLVTIRTLDCDICGRYDSIQLSRSEIRSRTKTTDMGIGAYSVMHKDHTRIIYFDVDGNFLGDTIALSTEEIPEDLLSTPLPNYVRNEGKQSWLSKFRKLLFSKLYSKHLTISIAGPSRAGKTSLVRYLETLVPERDLPPQMSVPTMGKSSKRIKLGNTEIRSLDMGGQQDFWDLWEESIIQSDFIFFLVDGSSRNIMEVAKAFERIITYRKNETPVLVVLNKKDRLLKGEVTEFINSADFLALTNVKLPLQNVLSIETSIFEGLTYISTTFEEVPLVEIITSFLNDFDKS